LAIAFSTAFVTQYGRSLCVIGFDELFTQQLTCFKPITETTSNTPTNKHEFQLTWDLSLAYSAVVAESLKLRGIKIDGNLIAIQYHLRLTATVAILSISRPKFIVFWGIECCFWTF